MRRFKRIGILLLTGLLLAGLFACAGTAHGSPQAATTFDFSEGEDGLPRGWTVESYEGRYETTLEDGVFGMSVDTADDCRLIRTVDVEPETRYVFTAEVKTLDVGQGQGATLSIDNYSLDGSYIYSESIYGTTDWTTLTLAFRTAKEQDRIVLALRLGGYSAVSDGAVWFRSVSLEASDNAPVPFQNLMPSSQSETKGERTQEDYENVFTVIFWAGAIAAIALLFGLYPRAKTLSLSPEPVGTRMRVFWLMVLIGALVRFLLCAKFKGHSTDIACWQGWGAKVATQGTHAFYVDNWCDYPPGYMLVCAGLWRIASVFSDGPESLRLFVYMLPAFAADVLSGLLLLKASKRFGCGDRLALLLAGLIVLNPAAVFLSGAWGQIDSILTVLLLGTFLLLNDSREKPWLRLCAGLLYGVAILMKWQALIFGPVLALLYVMTGVDQFGTKKFVLHVLWSAAAVIGALVVLLLGSVLFRGADMPLTWMVERFMSASGGYDYASVEAYNLFTLFGANWTKAGVEVFNGLSVGGMLLRCNELFSKVAPIILFPTLVIRAWNAMRTRRDGERNTAWSELLYAALICGVLALLHFLLKQASETGGAMRDIAEIVTQMPLYGVFAVLYLWYLMNRERGQRTLSQWLEAGTPTVVGAVTLFTAACVFTAVLLLGAGFRLCGAALTYKRLGVIGIIASGLLVVLLFLFYWKKHRAAKYSLYTNRGLIFLLAAAFCIWVFTFGHYMHERYIFPALFLLAFAYAYDRDPHKLAALCMLTVTTFMNEMVAMYVVSDGAIDLVRGGVLHNKLIALISLLEVGTVLYFTATAFLKARAFDPSDPAGTGEKPRGKRAKAERR